MTLITGAFWSDLDDNEFQQFIFNASDNTGTTDVTAELQAYIESANGQPVFIPPGTYLINQLAPDASINLVATPGTVTFKYSPNAVVPNSSTGSQGACITHIDSSETDVSLAYQNTNGLKLNVIGVTASTTYPDNYPDVNSDYVTAFTIDSATTMNDTTAAGSLSGTYDLNYGDIIMVAAKTSYAWSSNAWMGEAFKVLGVRSNVVYASQILECAEELQTYAGTLSFPADSGNIKIMKFATGRALRISGIKFQGDGDWRDLTIGAQTSENMVAISAAYTVGVSITDCEFDGLWYQAIALRSCPFSRVDNCQFSRGPNGNTYSPSITSTNGNYASTTDTSNVITVHIVGHGQADGAWVKLGSLSTATYNGIPSSELTGSWHEITVVDADNFTFTVTSTATSTRNIEESPGTWSFNATFMDRLGYGVLLYGPCAYTTIKNCKFTEFRHAITTGAAEASWSTSNLWRVGEPTWIKISDCESYGSYGPPWDTHEAGSQIEFINCSTYAPLKGPMYGSYRSSGIHVRCRNVKIRGYTQVGGNYGIRIDSIETQRNYHDIANVLIEDLYTPTSSTGVGILLADQTGITAANRYQITIRDTRIRNSPIGIFFQGGTKATILNTTFADVVQPIRVAGSAATVDDVCNTSNVHFDYTNNSKSATTRYIVYAASAIGDFTCNLHDYHITLGATYNPTSVFVASSTVATSIKANIGRYTIYNPSSVAEPTWVDTDSKYTVNLLTFRDQQHPGFVAGRYYLAGMLTETPSTTGALVEEDKIYAVPFYIARETTVTKLGLHVTVGAAGQTARLGIYKNNNGVPSTLVVDGGEIALDVGDTAVEATISTKLVPGWYWLALNAKNIVGTPARLACTTATSRSYPFYGKTAVLTSSGGTVTNAGPGIICVAQTYGALPASFPAVTSSSFDNTISIPILWWRMGV